MKIPNDFGEKAKAFFTNIVMPFAKKNPKVFFLICVSALLFCVVVFASFLPSPQGGGEAPKQAGRTEAKQKRAARIWFENRLVNGPVEVTEYGKEECTEVTIGNTMPVSAAVKIIPDGKPSSWGGTAYDPPNDLESAAVSFPLGNRYESVSFKIGFLPPAIKDEGAKEGGLYQVFIDGEKVWEKTVTPDEIANGKAADASLFFKTLGKNMLTLRIAGVPTPKEDFWRSSVPYPAILYDFSQKVAGLP